MAKYHVNKETGRANICRATKKGCPLGAATPHFYSKEEAKEFIETSEAKANDSFSVLKKENTQSKALQEAKKFREEARKLNWEPPLRDVEIAEAERQIAEDNKRIKEEALARGKKLNYSNGVFDGQRAIKDGRLGEYSTRIIVGRNAVFFYDDGGKQDDPRTLPNSFSNDSWQDTPRYSDNGGNLPGLTDAQSAFLKDLNYEDYVERPGETYSLKNSAFGGEISQYADEMIRRVQNGEVTKWDSETYDRNFKNISPKEKFFYALTNEDTGIVSHNVMYNVMVFPEKDLAPELERAEIHNVSVSPLKNGREMGLIYTVMQPDGSTRSFSVYEHRNTDSMIINGGTNWDPVKNPHGPYDEEMESSAKNSFFAEISYDTPKKQIASTLTYFLKSAQDGTLESDRELRDKAEHLDWHAILSETLGEPYKDFAAKQGYSSKPSLEQQMESLNEKDHFDKWEEQF